MYSEASDLKNRIFLLKRIFRYSSSVHLSLDRPKKQTNKGVGVPNNGKNQEKNEKTDTNVEFGLPVFVPNIEINN